MNTDSIIIASTVILLTNHYFVQNIVTSIRISDDDKIDHRLLPRAKKTKYDHERARSAIQQDYLAANAIFFGIQFKKTFRISRQRFEIIFQALSAKYSFFRESVDACGVRGACPAGKMLIALKTLAFGVSPESYRDYYQMSPTLARLCYDSFTAGIKRIYESEYLRFPSVSDLKKILRLHESFHGCKGMMGSLDVMHVNWDQCKMVLHGQFQGRDGNRTVALEAISDYNMYYWHISFGYPGSMNDLNVLNASPLIQKLTDALTITERHMMDIIPYQIEDQYFDKVYVLVDGIYPPWSRFVKTIQYPITPIQTNFSGWQESCRKDIERSFGVLRKSFKVLRNGIETQTLRKICNIVCACTILHNMRVEERVSGVGNAYSPDDGIYPYEDLDDGEHDAVSDIILCIANRHMFPSLNTW